MTIVNQSVKRTVQGNGSQTVFDYNFLIPEAAAAELHLIDDVTGTQTLLPPSSWSLSGVNNPLGGTFTYPNAGGGSALLPTQKLTLVRTVPNTQTTSLQNQSGFQPRTFEWALDRIVMQLQQIADGVSRSLRLPVAEQSTPGLPAAASRTNTVLSFDTNGSPLLLPLQPDNNTTVIAQGSLVPRSLAVRFADILNVRDFGAVSDGATNAVPAINLAGPGAFLPKGTFAADPAAITDDRGISGPGEVQHLFTWRTIGNRALTASYGDPVQDHIRHVYSQADAINNRPSLYAEIAGAPVSIPNITYADAPLSVVFDGIGAVRPSVGNTRMYVPPGTRLVRFSGFLRFASNATGIRSVALFKNNSFLTDQTNNALSGFATNTDFNFTVACVDGDYFELRAYQTSGGALNLNSGQISAEILYRHPQAVPGKRLLIYQGLWETQETAYGGYRALLNAVAQYDVLAVSHVEAFGVAPYPLLPNPNGILDGGYQKLKRLIHDYKDRNSKGIVFGYVSGAIDAPTWDGGGNPTNNAWTSTTYPNLNFWMDLWTQDRHLPIDGFFFDHYASAFMSATARDAVSLIAKQRGKKIMGNITSPSAANVQWAAECPHLSWGDYLCLEGFYRDNGVDVATQTNAVLAEMAKHETRGLLLAAVNEEAAATPITNGSVNNLNGASLFNSFYKPGWCYQYGRVSYDTIGTPAV